MDPPDGDNVGAVPQREYNDFDPFKAEHDFWNESSVEGFEDPGQDPMKPNRHKLFGQEYWVAKPMLMEKYDFDEHEIRGQVKTQFSGKTLIYMCIFLERGAKEV